MNETTFENARVWDVGYGWGEIIEIRDSSVYDEYIVIAFTQLVLDVCAQPHSPTYYRKCNSFGFNDLGMQTLFWDEVKFEAPPRPNRKVKKVVEGWVNIIEGDRMSCLYATEKTAITVRGRSVVYYGEPFFIHHEYEVEE